MPDFEDMFEDDEVEEPAVAEFDPSHIITIRTSGGETKYVPATEPRPVSEVMLSAGLTINGAVTYHMNGAECSLSTVVPVGATLMVVGSIKGG